MGQKAPSLELARAPLPKKMKKKEVCKIALLLVVDHLLFSLKRFSKEVTKYRSRRTIAPPLPPKRGKRKAEGILGRTPLLTRLSPNTVSFYPCDIKWESREEKNCSTTIFRA